MYHIGDKRDCFNGRWDVVLLYYDRNAHGFISSRLKAPYGDFLW